MGLPADNASTITQHYVLADAPDEQFEEVINEAKAEGLSRAP
ncbi:hypothetical protein DSM104299_00982 [Baekduia alba]|nr:hypothetical protein [Baekduia alba]WCB92292.1 hypothetical protein DSM104299_00982 [Baekduia alba]